MKFLISPVVYSPTYLAIFREKKTILVLKFFLPLVGIDLQQPPGQVTELKIFQKVGEY